MVFGGQEFDAGDYTIFWSHGDKRRALISRDWIEAKTTLKRVLGNFRGGESQFRNAQCALVQLTRPGRPVLLVLEGHHVGIVRPWASGRLTGKVPVMICRRTRLAHNGFFLPVLVSDVERARHLARALKTRLEPQRWILYEGEFAADSGERLFVARSDTVHLRSQLEEELVEVLRGGRDRSPIHLPPVAA
jgi:hypothetical protein